MADDDAKHGGGQADVLGCDEEVVPHHGLTPNPSSSARGRIIGNLRRLSVREQEARVAFQRVVDHGSGGSHVVENCPLSRFRAMA